MIPSRTRIVYVLLDGVGDLPCPQLNGLTPLQAASTPALDALAKRGCMGQVTTVGPNIAPQSDIAVFNMLGYDFKEEAYVGRGVIELIGSGIDFRTGDLALRGNFATIDGSNRIVDRRAGRNISEEEAKSICESLSSRVRFNDPNVSLVIKPTIGHRVVIRFRHNVQALSDQVSNTDPAYDKVSGIGVARLSSFQDTIGESVPEEDTIASKRSAHLINDFSNQAINILKSDSVNKQRYKDKKKLINCVLLRDAGNRIPKLVPIGIKYGMKAAAVVDMPVEIGIANVLSMQILPSGKVDDYKRKAEVVYSNLFNYDLIYAHIKGPDEFGHDGDAQGKKKNIEKIDKLVFSKLLDASIHDDVAIVVSADHSTPCVNKSHSPGPLPLLISSSMVQRDGSLRFTEEFAARGTLGRINGSQVISTVKHALQMS
ncbi:MAG: alkaline phosphatase family protein [Nitrososphaeraceae archaeon]|nr:alkaline phosphatase family protein [Nitrososphaeraceae archaeon]